MKASGRIRLVDDLRGLAALAVTWFHLTNTYSDESLVRQSGYYGWLGVEVFFVLSGFIIPYALSQMPSYGPQNFPKFMGRRLLRLEPPYIASIVLVIVLAYLSAAVPIYKGAEPSFAIGQVLSHFLYFVPLTEYNWIQVVYWTLAYEFVFYIFCGLLYSYLMRQEHFWRAAMLTIVVVGLVLSKAIGPLWLLFVMGIAAYRREVFQEQTARFIGLIAVASIAMIFMGYVLQASVGAVTALCLGYRQVAKWPTSSSVLRVLGFFGAISYSLYLVHVPIGGRVVNLGRRYVEGDVAELCLSLTGFALAVGAASVFYLLIEKPATMLSRRFDGRVPPIWRFRSST